MNDEKKPMRKKRMMKLLRIEVGILVDAAVTMFISRGYMVQRIYTYTNQMLIHVNFCQRHGYIKDIRPRKSYCNGNSMSLRFSIMDIEHLLRYMRQELTSSIALTEREPITSRR